MKSEPPDITTLLGRWHSLPAGDRRAILQRMVTPKRLAFERLLATAEREKADAEMRNRRFRAYSPWLAALLDACEKEGALASTLTPVVRFALLESQEQVASSQNSAKASLTPGENLRSFWRELRDRL